MRWRRLWTTWNGRRLIRITLTADKGVPFVIHSTRYTSRGGAVWTEAGAFQEQGQAVAEMVRLVTGKRWL